MAKSARASSIKKNNTGLKKRVFGPVEIARSERLSAKLLALAQAPKPPRPEKKKKDIELEDAENVAAEKEAEPTEEGMDVDSAATKEPRGNGFRLSRNVKQKEHKASRVGKSTHRKPRNNIVFKKSGRVKKGGK